MAGEFPVKGKGRALAARPDQESKKESKLWDGDRNLCAMNQSSGDSGNGEGVGAGLGVGRGAGATSGGTASCRGVSTAADSGEDGYREDHCE
jgi:hypothetical protein